MTNYTPTAIQVRPLLGSVTVKGEAGEATDVGKIVKLNSDNEWIEAIADSAANASNMIGMIVSGSRGENDGAIIEGEGVDVLVYGPVYVGDTQALDVLDSIYLASVSGLITNVKPAVVRPLGYPLSPTTLFFNPATLATY